MAEDKRRFPTEVVDLPSKGLLYSKDSPLASGTIELKYMTAKEEDILTSRNLIQKGIVLDKLLESVIVDEKVSLDDLLLGDKNAIMIATRVLGYGKDYTEKQTPTIMDCVNLCRQDRQCHVFAYGTRKGFKSTTNHISDGRQ